MKGELSQIDTIALIFVIIILLGLIAMYLTNLLRKRKFKLKI